MFAEQEQCAACQNAIVMAQPDLGSTLTIHPGSILRTKILDQEMIALRSNYKVPARKGLVIDLYVGGIITADCQRVVAKFPATDGQTVVAK